MSLTPKVQYKHFPAETKWDAEQHRYEPSAFGAWGKQSLSRIGLRSTDGDQELFASFEVEHSRRDYLRAQIESLLAGHKISGFKVSDNGNASGLKLEGPLKDKKAFFQVLSALSHNFEDPKQAGTTFYAVLDAEIAHEIASQELQRLVKAGAKLEDFGVAISTETLTGDRQRAYGFAVDGPLCRIDFSGSALAGVVPVSFIEEDFYPGRTVQDKTGPKFFTKMFVLADNVRKLKSAFEGAGFKFESSPLLKSGEVCLTVTAPFNDVVRVASETGALPANVHQRVGAMDTASSMAPAMA